MTAPRVSASAIRRIWAEDGFRLFLSHISGVSKQANNLKEELRVYGVSAFVAHANIRAMQEWEKEIKRALYSMDGLAAALSGAAPARD